MRTSIDALAIRKTQRPASDFELDTEEATQIAVYVLETVKRHDPYCGGPTKLGILRHPSRIDTSEHVLVIQDLSGNVLNDDSLPVFIPCQPEIDKIAKKVSSLDTLIKFNFWVEIAKALSQETKERVKTLKKASAYLKKRIERKSGKS